jgi:hypothetical protein
VVDAYDDDRDHAPAHDPPPREAAGPACPDPAARCPEADGPASLDRPCFPAAVDGDGAHGSGGSDPSAGSTWDDGHDDDAPLPFLVERLTQRFSRRVVTLGPGSSVPYVEQEWRGAVVVVERGDVEFECQRGGLRRFGPGDVLWMDGLGLRHITNPGEEPTKLVAVSRRVDADPDPPASGSAGAELVWPPPEALRGPPPPGGNGGGPADQAT